MLKTEYSINGAGTTHQQKNQLLLTWTLNPDGLSFNIKMKIDFFLIIFKPYPKKERSYQIIQMLINIAS